MEQSAKLEALRRVADLLLSKGEIDLALIAQKVARDNESGRG